MKIRRFRIDSFKNLRQFEITFCTDSLTTVIVGKNGTGKSNLLEAIVLVFRNLDLNEMAPFSYELEYETRGRVIDVAAKAGAQPTATIDGTSAKLSEVRAAYLPEYVIGYYSGPSNRLETHFEKHQTLYYRELLAGNDGAHRRLFYARLVHSQFVLLSFFIERDDAGLELLRDLLGVDGLDSVLLVMRQPPWTSREGDDRFWNAKGVVQAFLDRVYNYALAPLRLDQRIATEFVKTTKLEHLYLYLKSEDQLRRLGRDVGDRKRFFAMLESTYTSKLLSEVRIRVRLAATKHCLTFRELSEGEQQFLTVVGLLRFTRSDESLFLLDEPDTHLNPNWAMTYLPMLNRAVGGDDTSQIVMTTHDPLVVSGLTRHEVRVLEKRDGRIASFVPDEDPRGLGVGGILASELFGLRSTLDPETLRMLDEKRVLASKPQLTDADRAQLSKINEKLSELAVNVENPDPLYRPFVEAMSEALDVRPGTLSLTREEQAKVADLAREVVAELLREPAE
jgi:predicted ATPase